MSMTRSSPRRTPQEASRGRTAPTNATRASPRRHLDLGGSQKKAAAPKRGKGKSKSLGKKKPAARNVINKKPKPVEPNLGRTRVVDHPRNKVPEDSEDDDEDEDEQGIVDDNEDDMASTTSSAKNQLDGEEGDIENDNAPPEGGDDENEYGDGENTDGDDEWQGDSSSDDEEIETGKSRHGTHILATFSQQKLRRHLTNMNTTGVNEVASKPNQPGMVASSAANVNLDKVLVHVYTKKESMRHRESHVATRVRSYVKNVLFRNIKFVNTEIMIQRAMKLVMKFENVKERKQLEFHMLYESVFNEALNTKRSSCEQAGGKIVMESLESMKPGDEFFTIEELCKLRQSSTEKEKQAFYWFFGTFLECVCGKKAWGKMKYHGMISSAKLNMSTTERIVTVSDEAFALLIFENYIEKWVEAYEATKEQVIEAEGHNRRGEKKVLPRRRGKYTGAMARSGHCKFGGWNREGMARFNDLYNMVIEDRACPQAEAMEREFLEFCKTERNLDGVLDEGGEGATKSHANVEAAPVEAMWDIDTFEI